jgi:heptosyltransferase-2
MKTIAVLLPNWVGDLAMATPALRALRGKFPQSKIVGVLKPYLADVLGGNPWLDELVLCNHQRWFGERAFWPTVGKLRGQRLDAIVSFRGTMRGTLMALASGAKQRVGYGHQLFAATYHRRYRPKVDVNRRQIESAVDVYLQTVAQLGCDVQAKLLELQTTPADEALTDAVWQRLNLPDGDRVVMLNSGSAQGSAKSWPAENAANLARQMVDRWGATVLINCGPQERESARHIVSLANRPAVKSLADEEKLPFGLLKGLLRRVRLLVSTDSGPRHLAAAVGTPVVAVFGAMDPRLSHNHHPFETIVKLNLDCMPCNDYNCPLGHLRCMRDLSAEQVLAAAEGYWLGKKRAAA